MQCVWQKKIIDTSQLNRSKSAVRKEKNLCDKKFVERGHLNIHLKMHT